VPPRLNPGLCWLETPSPLAAPPTVPRGWAGDPCCREVALCQRWSGSVAYLFRDCCFLFQDRCGLQLHGSQHRQHPGAASTRREAVRHRLAASTRASSPGCQLPDHVCCQSRQHRHQVSARVCSLRGHQVASARVYLRCCSRHQAASARGVWRRGRCLRRCSHHQVSGHVWPRECQHHLCCSQRVQAQFSLSC